MKLNSERDLGPKDTGFPQYEGEAIVLKNMGCLKCNREIRF